MALGRSLMYTPQMIVNGQYEVNSPTLTTVAAAIRNATRMPRTPVSLSLSEGDLLSIAVGKLPPGSGQADILLAVAESGLKVTVAGGENKGETIVHAPTVMSLTRLGTLEGSKRSEYTAEAKLQLRPEWNRANLRLVLLLQDQASRRILGAASLQLEAPKSETAKPR